MRSVLTLLLIMGLSLPLLAVDRDGVLLVNRERKASGMLSLRNNSQLARAAYHHAKYLGRLRAKGHTEKPGRSFYYGRTPFDRFIRAGYPSRVGVENISYGDRNYRQSVRVLMSTVYHRLAFLDFRIDEMGSSEYGNRRGRIYVYDMAASTVAGLCRKAPKGSGGQYIYGVCSDKNIKLPKREFFQALHSIERRNAPVVLYPYPGMRNAPRRYIRETPDPVPKLYAAGVPITAQFNPSRYRRVTVKRFKLYDGKGRDVRSRLITPATDRHKKLPVNTFVLIPLKTLGKKEKYWVVLEAVADGKRVKREWSFSTGG